MTMSDVLTTKPSVIIDCDPGTDDAVALLMALGTEAWKGAWRVDAFTTVGGNVELARATRNTLAILEYVGRADIPVVPGASRPLSGRYEYAYGFHGPGGMANTRLPKATTEPAQGTAVDYLASALSRAHDQPKVVAVGPLTNVARLLARHPSVANALAGLVVMGGAVNVPERVLPHGSEFNFRGDPLAAHRVLTSGTPLTLVHLGACLQVGLSRADMSRLAACGPLGRLAARIVSNWFRVHPDRETYHLPDPLAIAVAIDPTVVRLEPTRLSVRVEGETRLGETLPDPEGSKVMLAVEVDQERYYRLLYRCLGEGQE